ncbi:TetR/AcrR family transcriptional regulator [Kyrpidia tusciae]|uniref:Transcriptional regulator, TetR family n=1 Tax=Kyrpidia tusciae (strain DSM 2912 / NBRC 15312 / T2) TaxID=562970 RepID=D5WUD1_KYRT2|nr:TetR/AcrR family transcriptional regulator [Kyrpidia tusciae]ADG07383.1 transcriptional regulator, TetR family [Kyrpidia tusciae DSM 2912]
MRKSRRPDVLYFRCKCKLTVRCSPLADKMEQILKAARNVFIEKGYEKGTTMEIAKAAGVAELTLFRKFGSKRNLFLAAFKPYIERRFIPDILETAEECESPIFFRRLLQNRLMFISHHTPVLRMLIAESLLHRLPPEIDLPKLIIKEVGRAVEWHFNARGIKTSAEPAMRLLYGIFLGHIVQPTDPPFHVLSPEEQETLVERYTAAILTLIRRTP